MNRTGRREALAQIAALALGPFAVGLPGRISAQTIALHTAPQGGYLLTRRLQRQLGTGEHLIVRRTWRCEFEQTGPCIAVRGEQVACEVEAPEMLAPLAVAERARVSALFPLELDAAGVICAATPITPDADLAAAARAALTLLKEPDPASREFVATLSRSAAQLVSAVPDDLFFPAEGGARNERTVPLGPQGEGSIVVATAAQVRPDNGLLLHSEKEVTTILGPHVRRAGESWTLRAV